MKRGVRHYARHIGYDGCFCQHCRLDSRERKKGSWRAAKFRVAKKKERRAAFREEFEEDEVRRDFRLV